MKDKSPKEDMAETNYLIDLLKAQKEIEGVDKDGKNPFFKSEYTTLNSTIIACKEILNRYNFIVLQPIQSDENGVYVCTTLLHTSGRQIDSKMKIEQSKSNDPQAQGSAITYARRYALKSLLTMSDQDDDGENAMSRKTHKAGVSTQPHSSQTSPTAQCAVHKVPMRQFEKNGKKWFSHKLDDGTWCNGTPPKVEKFQPQDDYAAYDNVADEVPY